MCPIGPLPENSAAPSVKLGDVAESKHPPNSARPLVLDKHPESAERRFRETSPLRIATAMELPGAMANHRAAHFFSLLGELC